MLPLTYTAGSLHVRWLRTLLTMLGISLVVAVFCQLLCLAAGLREALAISGDPRNVIVLAEGATAESNSAVSNEDVKRLIGLPGVARDARGRSLVSPEVLVQTNLTRRGESTGTCVGVTVRGVYSQVALQVHPGVEIVAGRWFREGADELVVGAGAREQFARTALGSLVACGERKFTVVGVFRARGSVHESELWGYLSNVAAAYRRQRYSSATIRLTTDRNAALTRTQKRIAAAGIALRGVSEPEYYLARAGSAGLIEGLATVLVVLMGAGAVFAAINTTHASVAGRSREIGMLRAIGFSRGSVVAAVLTESVVLATVGGALGCLACAVFFLLGSGTRDLIETSTYSSVAFRVRPSPGVALWGMAVAAAIGLLGGLWPAWAASRVRLVHALRAA